MIPILHASVSNLVVSSYTQHGAFMPPPPPAGPVPFIPGLIEGPVSLGWPLGALMHKTQPTVLVDGAPGVKQGHDAGYGIPHLQVPMNAMMAVHTALSKHKVMFPVPTVFIGGSPAGTYMPFSFGLICANPVSLPTGVVMLIKCTVWTSFTWSMLFKGIGYIALEIAIDVVWNRITKGGWFEKSEGRELWKPFKPFAEDGYKKLLGCSFLNILGNPDKMRLALTWLARSLGNKGIEHISKGWVFTPLTRDLVRGKMGIGRGRADVKFFDAGWW